MRRLLFIGQALDAATFALFFLAVPSAVLAQIAKTEQNPLLAVVLAVGGVGAVVLLKVGLVSFVVMRDKRRQRRPKATGALMLVAAGSGYVGAAFNLLALVTLFPVFRGLP